ncbi:MAG: CBS domain-containing protein [Candidatus Rokuibacteriota bacterium]
MKVASILKHKGAHVETVRPGATVYSAVWELRLKAIGALVVSEDGRAVLGVISERDIVRGLIEHGQGLLGFPVSRVMTAPAVTCTPEDSITAVMALMTRQRVRHLPVIDHDRLCGIVSIGDVVKHRLDEMELEANVLRETLIASH